MPLLELLFALPALVWGGVLWTWFQTRSLAVRLWTVVGATVLTTVIPAMIYAAADEGTRHVVRGILD